MEGRGGCLWLLFSPIYFAWVHVAASRNARAFGRQHAVPGPEANDLLSRLSGTLVACEPGGGIRAVTLPRIEQKHLRQPSRHDQPPFPSVHSISGPDHQRRVAYIENRMAASPEQSQHCLRVLGGADGQDRVLFTRPGDALWETAIGDHLALSPLGGKIAFLSQLTSVQMAQPPVLLETGGIEIWSIDEGKGRETGIIALDAGLSWFPDGQRMAFAALVSKDQVPTGPLEPDRFGGDTAGWPQVSAVDVLDTETSETEILHPGRNPVVSTDGRTVLVVDFEYRWRLVDTATRQSTPVRVPGQWGAPIALIDSRLVLYRGYPTAGTPIRLTAANSPLSGPKLMLSVKVADIDSSEFQTILPYFDPRTHVSYGAVAP
jgi:hypothetical protein